MGQFRVLNKPITSAKFHISSANGLGGEVRRGRLKKNTFEEHKNKSLYTLRVYSIKKEKTLRDRVKTTAYIHFVYIA